MSNHYYQGFFKPKNPKKYKGDPTNITFRSGWECSCMKYFDEHPDIIWWSSEEIIIPYRSPVDNKIHRYFPDFVIKIKTTNNKEEIIMIEVKPLKQTKPPEQQKRVTKRFINEVHTYAINTSKWEAARSYCDKKGWKFQILTEKELNVI